MYYYNKNKIFINIIVYYLATPLHKFKLFYSINHSLLYDYYPSLCLFRLQPPMMPNYKIFSDVIADAFALAIVGYAISISLGKTFALKHGYKVCSNQVIRQIRSIDRIFN